MDTGWMRDGQTSSVRLAALALLFLGLLATGAWLWHRTDGQERRDC
jgi:hypothetical protein